jgi:hypothetical protein
MSQYTIQISALGVRHDPMLYSSRMFAHEVQNYYFLGESTSYLEKIVFFTKRESYYEFIFFTVRR